MNKKIKEEYIFSSEDKIKWWGQGEWVGEPDLVSFQYKGIECKVVRMTLREPCAKDFQMFGGYLNGYVAIPFGHLYYQKTYDDMDIECHGGLTFGECFDRHWIGFDSAHLHDYVPSTELFIKNMIKTSPEMQDSTYRLDQLKDKLNLHDSPIFMRTYRNIQFCIDQCKSIAEQLIEIGKK